MSDQHSPQFAMTYITFSWPSVDEQADEYEAHLRAVGIVE